jgi:hypothetical protein
MRSSVPYVIGAVAGALLIILVLGPFKLFSIAQQQVQGQPSVFVMTWWTAVGSGAGGFLGVAFMFALRWWIDYLRSRPKEIKSYDAVTLANRGTTGEQYGELKHHFGRIAFDPKRPDREVWECTQEPVGDPHKEASAHIYGPYSTDCHEPGVYLAKFKILGIGFGRRDTLEIINVLVLDVSQSSDDHPRIRRVAMGYVKPRELARDGWQEYDLPFYSEGFGTYEYRVSSIHDNLSRCGDGTRILVDSVTLYKVPSSVRLPEV